MKIVNAGYEILFTDLNDPKVVSDIYSRIETAGRTCYKSSGKGTDESAEKFVRMVVKNGHEAMLEHAGLTVRFTVDRGVSHEIVRHRMASFAQESTRYCNYSQDKFGNEITVIEPVFFKGIPKETKDKVFEALYSFKWNDEIENFLKTDGEREEVRAYARWHESCVYCEINYNAMLERGCTPEEARSVLPNSLKTEVVMTANMREWRHFLKLRVAGVTGKPHPQMLEVAVPLLNELRMKLPALFDDISPMEE